MINLSSGGANEDGIFLHADVKTARLVSKVTAGTKNGENNPMHSSRGVQKQRPTYYPKFV
ncbi:hypothetical protein AB7M17_003458 [Bradyrhizobium sp. USDA 377]